MKSLINKIVIGLVFVVGLMLIPADKAKADTFTYNNYVVEASLDKNISSGESYEIGSTMYVRVDAYDPYGNPYFYGASADVSVVTPTIQTLVWKGNLAPTSGYWSDTQIPSSKLPMTPGGYEVGIIMDVTTFYNNIPESSGIMVGLPFMMSDPVTVTPPVDTTPTAKTVDIQVYKTSNLSTPLLKNANNVTTEPIVSGTPIRLSWEAKGFNNNVICTIPPNGTQTSANFGDIDLSTGPTSTTTYSVTCNDDVTAPTAPATTTLHINTGFTGQFVNTSPSNAAAPSGQGGKLIVRINGSTVCNTSDPSYPVGVGGQGYNISDCGSGNYNVKAGDVISISASGYQNYHNVSSYKVGSMQFMKNSQDLLNFTSSSAINKDYSYTISDTSANYSVGVTFNP